MLLSTHMQPPDPLVLHYEIGTHCLDSNTEMDTSGPGTLGHLTPGGIGVNKDGRSAIKAFDIEMDMDDLWMRSKIADVSHLSSNFFSHRGLVAHGRMRRLF